MEKSSTVKAATHIVCLQVGLVHGKMMKICPHTSTGRADYFGTTVNKAARLLYAANAGQILVEAPVMEEVLKQWNGDAFNLAPVHPGSSKGPSFNTMSKTGATRGAAAIEAGNLVLPDLTDTIDDSLSGTPRIKSAPQLSLLEQPLPDSNETAADGVGVQLRSEDEPVPQYSYPLQLSQAGRNEGGSTRGWTPRAPHAGMRSSVAGGKASKQPAVSFALQPKERRLERKPSAAFLPRRSTEGVSYEDPELEQLDILGSCCAPYAADSPLAVSNCHMLKFLAASGIMQGRKEDIVVFHRRARPFPRIVPMSRSAGDSPSASEELPGSMSGLATLRSESSDTSGAGSRRASLLALSEPEAKLPAFAKAKLRGTGFAESDEHVTMTVLLAMCHLLCACALVNKILCYTVA